MYTRVVAEHYKSLDSMDLSLGRLQVFVGPNGSGKSNLIDVVRFIRDAVSVGLDRAVSERHGIDSVRQWSPSKPYHVTLRAEVSTDRGTGSLSFTLASRSGTHLVRREKGVWNPRSSRGTAGRQVKYSRNEDGLVRVRGLGDEGKKVRAPQEEELFLTQFRTFQLSPLLHALSNFEAYSIFPNTLRTPQKPSSEQRLSATGDNLAAVFKLMTRSKRRGYSRARSEIISSLQKVMPQLENISIQSIGGLHVPQFRVREPDGRAHDFNVSQVSDGTLRVLGLLTALYQPEAPDTIAMEEPEQTVNPGILGLLAEAIETTSESRTQVLVTTHSPELLDRLSDPSVVYAVDQVDGITRVGPVNEDQVDAVRKRLFTLGELMAAEGLVL